MAGPLKHASERALTLRLGFIGAGRLGTALAWALSRAGWQVCATSSRTERDARDLACKLPRCQVLTAQEVVDACDLVFITTHDSAIQTVAEALQWRSGVMVVHCSGATEVDALAHAAAAGASIGGFHPMQTFGDPAAAVDTLPGSTITIEAEGELFTTLQDLATALSCRVNRLPPGMRGRYHAAAGYTSQFINALFDQALTIWRSWGARDEDALQALLPLAHGTLVSIRSAGVAKGMPGPVSRGDLKSIAKHLDAIGEMNPEALAFYKTLCAATVPISQSGGLISMDTAHQFEAMLEAHGQASRAGTPT